MPSPRRPRRLLADLGGVTLLSAAGVSALLEVQRRLLDAGGQLQVVRPSPVVRSVLEIAGVATLLAAPPRLDQLTEMTRQLLRTRAAVVERQRRATAAGAALLARASRAKSEAQEQRITAAEWRARTAAVREMVAVPRPA